MYAKFYQDTLLIICVMFQVHCLRLCSWKLMEILSHLIQRGMHAYTKFDEDDTI